MQLLVERGNVTRAHYTYRNFEMGGVRPNRCDDLVERSAGLDACKI
jgi:hypothetical protein